MGSVVFCVASHRHDDGRFVVVESGDERERRGALFSVLFLLSV
jgi:hypothetical protein